MQIRVAVICDYKLLPDRIGGMDHFFWAFNVKCKENNIEVDWFLPNKSEFSDYKTLNILAPNNNSSLTDFVVKTIKERNYTYTHIITHFVELCTSFFRDVKMHTKGKVFAVDHNPRPLGGYSIKKKLKKRIKAALYSKYIDVFVGVSEYTVNELIKDFGNFIRGKTKVLYNGVTIDDIQINSNRKLIHPTFIVASHLRESKGVQDLIDAVYKLRLKGISIDVFGSGPYETELHSKVKKYNLEEEFKFNGSVSNLNELYKNYDYMILPSHMECFSLAILESLAANVPVIASNVGGNEEAITHNKNGFIFEAKNIDNLSEIIKDVYLGDSKITSDTRKEIEEKYALTTMVNQYFELLL
ncbi:MAG: hypothetical protein Wins2KO_15400 [Winogradskyella sp.]